MTLSSGQVQRLPPCEAGGAKAEAEVAHARPEDAVSELEADATDAGELSCEPELPSAVSPRRLLFDYVAALPSGEAAADPCRGQSADGAACASSPMEEVEDEMTPSEAELEADQAWVPLLPHHPDRGACWDWPLSRHECKARVQLLDRQIMLADNQVLLQRLEHALSKDRGGQADYADADTVEGGAEVAFRRRRTTCKN